MKAGKQRYVSWVSVIALLFYGGCAGLWQQAPPPKIKQRGNDERVIQFSEGDWVDIYTQDGRRYSGRLAGVSEETVTLGSDSSVGLVEISLEQVARIEEGEPPSGGWNGLGVFTFLAVVAVGAWVFTHVVPIGNY